VPALDASEPLIARLTDRLRWHYGHAAGVGLVRAPYRICPLGAHVDHQWGQVTGMAIDQGVWLAFAPVRERRVRLRSLDFPGEVDFPLDPVPPPQPGDWGNYARGAVMALQSERPLQRGLEGVIGGTLPLGGLSSSAAVGVAYLLALEAVNGWEVSPHDNIRLDQAIENGYLGLRNGILDQSIILLSRADRLLFLDCMDQTFRHVARPAGAPEYGWAIVYSGVSEALVGTAYNQRVAECEEAARQLLQRAGESPPPGVKLRHVPREVFEAYGDTLPPPLARRARHFFTEIQRVQAGVAAWEAGDMATFGQLMRESGRSSIENYECGSPELTALYEILLETPGVWGARFSGAGFRGSCIALIDPDSQAELRARVAERYLAAFPGHRDRFSIHFCHSADGAQLW